MRPTRLTLGELATIWVDEPVAPFHIALAGEFDATAFRQDDGTLDLERVRAELVRRIGRVEILHRRIVWPRIVWPRIGEGRPYWADDPSFHPDRQVTCAYLPDGLAFLDWCAQAILWPLDRSRPLWRAVVVGGLPGGRFGVLIVVHHAVAGGLAGVALAAALLDAGPEGTVGQVSMPTATERSPTAAETQAVPAESPRQRLRRRRRQLTDAAADLRTRAPVTSLSRPTGSGRRLATVRLPLGELQDAGHRLGVTVNDLLLAAVSGGLRELLVGRGDDVTDLALRASLPVGARTAGQPDGMLLVRLPVGEADPLRCLAVIHEDTARLKSRLRRGGGDILDVLQLPLPLPVARMAVLWMRRIARGRINLFVTNVPGPVRPLWLAGARLLDAVPVAPLVHGVPLGIAALSYGDTLHVGISADAAVDDLDVLSGGVQRSVTALTEATRAGARLPEASGDAPDERGTRAAMVNAVTIERDPGAVFAFMTDPRHELDWNPQLLAVEQRTHGPIRLGTRFRLQFGHGVGDSTVTYTAFDPPHHWSAVSTSRHLDVRLEGSVAPAGPGTRLVVRTRLLPRGILRPLTPLLRRYMHSTWDRHLAVIKTEMENPRKGQCDEDRDRLRERVRQHP